MTCAVWSGDSRWLVLGTADGDFALWEADSLKVHRLQGAGAHKDSQEYGIPVTAVTWGQNVNMLVSGDKEGTILFSDEVFRQAFVIRHAHTAAVRGLSYSPYDSKLASGGDDSVINIWAVGTDKPEKALTGHTADIKVTTLTIA